MVDTDRRKLLKLGGTGALLAFGGVGTTTARPGRRKGASAEETIFEIADANDDLQILVSALEATGLDGVLDRDHPQYTVFAPTDAGFEALLDELGITAEELLASPDLQDILLYHVTNGRRYAASVVRAPEIEMLNGGTVTVNGRVLNGGQAEIGATDIEAANGIVHVIDGVLLQE